MLVENIAMEDITITRGFLHRRAERARNYPKARWIVFCEAMLDRGYTVTLHEAHTSVSKYVTVWNAGRSFVVRFSNHKPNKTRELRNRWDYFVGITNTGVRTTDDAIAAAVEYLGECPFVSSKMD